MHERDPKVSVITVCLNSEKTIERTIRSVISQTYPNIEYIVIDGKSTDRTLEIIGKYRDKISRLVSEEDQGIYHAMNKGLTLTTGALIGFIHSDDWYEPHAVETVVSAFIEGGYTDVIYGNMNIYDDKASFLRTRYPSPLKELYTYTALPHPSVFIRGDIYRKYGFDTRYRCAADRDLLLKLYSQGHVFRYIDRSIANFCTGGYSLGHPQRSALESAMISFRYTKHPGVILKIGLRFLWGFALHSRVARPAVWLGGRVIRAFRARRLKP